MGIDWEEILDVEGADMVEVYNENIPEEDSKYYGLVVENHYSGSGDTVGAYIYSIMWHFNQAVASLVLSRSNTCVRERYRGPVPVILLSKSPHGKCNSFALS